MGGTAAPANQASSQGRLQYLRPRPVPDHVDRMNGSVYLGFSAVAR